MSDWAETWELATPWVASEGPYSSWLGVGVGVELLGLEVDSSFC